MSAAAGVPHDGAPSAGGAFSRAVVLALIVVGALSFAAFVVLSAYAPDLRSGSDGRGHALSRSAVGYAALVALLETRGDPILIRRSPERDIDDDSLLVLTPPAGASVGVEAIVAPFSPTLIVLPKWSTFPAPETPGWVREAGLLDDGSVARTLPSEYGKFVIARAEDDTPERLAAVDPVLPLDAALVAGPIRSFQTISGPTLETVIAAKGGRTVLGRIAHTETYVLAEPDLLATHGLADAATAWTAVQIIETLAGPNSPVHFDVTLHGFERSRNILKVAFEPPFLPATLSALAAALLMALNAATRFGPAQRMGRAFALGKAALVDNSAGLVRMTKREARMAPGYAALTLGSAARAVGVARGATDDAQRRVLDRLSATAGVTPYTALETAALTAKDPDALLTAARALHAWRMEMTRERR